MLGGKLEWLFGMGFQAEIRAIIKNLRFSLSTGFAGSFRSWRSFSSSPFRTLQVYGPTDRKSSKDDLSWDKKNEATLMGDAPPDNTLSLWGYNPV